MTASRAIRTNVSRTQRACPFRGRSGKPGGTGGIRRVRIGRGPDVDGIDAVGRRSRGSRSRVPYRRGAGFTPAASASSRIRPLQYDTSRRLKSRTRPAGVPGGACGQGAQQVSPSPTPSREAPPALPRGLGRAGPPAARGALRRDRAPLGRGAPNRGGEPAGSRHQGRLASTLVAQPPHGGADRRRRTRTGGDDDDSSRGRRVKPAPARIARRLLFLSLRPAVPTTRDSRGSAPRSSSAPQTS